MKGSKLLDICLSTVFMCMQRVGDRAVILSGMNAAEIGEIIGAYRDAGISQLPATHPHASFKAVDTTGHATSCRAHANLLCRLSSVRPNKGVKHSMLMQACQSQFGLQL